MASSVSDWVLVLVDLNDLRVLAHVVFDNFVDLIEVHLIVVLMPAIIFLDRLTFQIPESVFINCWYLVLIVLHFFLHLPLIDVVRHATVFFLCHRLAKLWDLPLMVILVDLLPRLIYLELILTERLRQLRSLGLHILPWWLCIIELRVRLWNRIADALTMLNVRRHRNIWLKDLSRGGGLPLDWLLALYHDASASSGST